MSTAHIGKPINRVDGRAKVTGEAKYAAEYATPGLAYGWVVSSPIARGKIVAIDASEALKLPGVIQVFSHENRPSMAWFDSSYRDQIAPPGSPFRPLYDAEVHFSAQPVALVVADSPELARYASTLVRIDYETRPHATELGANLESAHTPKERDGIKPPPKARGHADKALAAAPVRVDVEYEVPVEHHNPMEMFATTVVRDEDGTFTVYDKTQGVQNVRDYLCNVLGFKPDEIRVVAAYVGGAFGSGLRPQYQVFLAVLAARELKRSVRVVLTRQQMFSLGHRPDDAAAGGPRCVRRRSVAGGHPRGDGRDLAVRGLQRGGGQLVGPALPVRQRPVRAQGRPARPAHPVRHAGPRGGLGRVRAREPPWTSSPSRSGSTPSSCG